MASDPPPAPPADSPRLTTGDAHEFLMTVKREFDGERDTYEQFLAVMCDFKHGSIGTHAVVSRVKVLFDGHPDLIRGFNEYLPNGKKLDVPREAEEAPAGAGRG